MNRRLALVIALAVSLVAAGAVRAHDNDERNSHERDQHEGKLSAIAGQGHGKVEVEPIGGTIGFSVEIEVKVRGAAPNTTFYIQRAPEVGRPLGADGICQRADGLYPWEQPNSVGFMPAPAFVTFPRPLAGDLKTLTTGPDGKGRAEFIFDLPTLADGTVFDVEFRLVDSLTAPTTELRSGCLTVMVL